jgi:hypothetical protein
MADLGSLQHSSGAQVSTVEQIRTEEAHPNSVRLVNVSPSQLAPVHDVLLRWNTVGFKFSPSNVGAGLHLEGTRYARDTRVGG